MNINDLLAEAQKGNAEAIKILIEKGILAPLKKAA